MLFVARDPSLTLRMTIDLIHSVSARVKINIIHLLNATITIYGLSGFVDVDDEHFGAVGLFDVFDVCMFVGWCALVTLGVLFVEQALDDSFDEVG